MGSSSTVTQQSAHSAYDTEPDPNKPAVCSMEWKYSIFKGYTLSTTLDSVNLLVPEKRSGVFKPKRGPLPKKGQYAMGVVDEKICGQIVWDVATFFGLDHAKMMLTVTKHEMNLARSKHAHLYVSVISYTLPGDTRKLLMKGSAWPSPDDAVRSLRQETKQKLELPTSHPVKQLPWNDWVSKPLHTSLALFGQPQYCKKVEASQPQSESNDYPFDDPLYDATEPMPAQETNGNQPHSEADRISQAYGNGSGSLLPYSDGVRSSGPQSEEDIYSFDKAQHVATELTTTEEFHGSQADDGGSGYSQVYGVRSGSGGPHIELDGPACDAQDDPTQLLTVEQVGSLMDFLNNGRSEAMEYPDDAAFLASMD